MMLKRIIKETLVRLPVVNRFFFQLLYHRIKDEKGIRGKIQQVAHRIDQHISQNWKAPSAAIKEFEFLLNEMQRRKIAMDEAIYWSLTIYAIGKHGLQNQYFHNLRNTESSVEVSHKQANLLASIKERRSVRKWTDEQIDSNDIKEVIDIAKWAPSSCNRQAWQALLVNRQQDKEFLLDYFNNKFWLPSPLLIVIMMNIEPYSDIEKHYPYLDAGAFIQNLLLTLHARGYGACWIGFAKWNTLNNISVSEIQRQRFYEYFRLNSQLIPVSMVAVGRPAVRPRASSRQSVQNINITDFLEGA